MRIGYKASSNAYCDYVLAALCVRYCDCCAMSLWHQVCLVLCIVYCVSSIRSVVYCVLGLSYIVLGHWVLGPYALDATSRATAASSKCEIVIDYRVYTAYVHTYHL